MAMPPFGGGEDEVVLVTVVTETGEGDGDKDPVCSGSSNGSSFTFDIIDGQIRVDISCDRSKFHSLATWRKVDAFQMPVLPLIA